MCIAITRTNSLWEWSNWQIWNQANRKIEKLHTERLTGTKKDITAWVTELRSDKCVLNALYVLYFLYVLSIIQKMNLSVGIFKEKKKLGISNFSRINLYSWKPPFTVSVHKISFSPFRNMKAWKTFYIIAIFWSHYSR